MSQELRADEFARHLAPVPWTSSVRWSHTIVPRLMAAGADLYRVFRVDVASAEGVNTALSLPLDLLALEQVVREVDAALVILDPQPSRLDARLDAHVYAQGRLELKRLVKLAEAADVCVLGGLSRSTIYFRVSQGAFRAPVSLGGRAVGWIEA